MSSLRLVSSARNLREQFNRPTSPVAGTSSNLVQSSGASVSSGVSQSRTLEPTSSLSRQGSLPRSTSSGNLRRTKSMQKKTLISKVFADDSSNNNELQDLSMEMTLLVVKRCVKEIRERGLTTKGILKQQQMGLSHSATMETIRQILDDDANTALSALHKIDIHQVAHAMKAAIRYSEETLVTYEDYQALFLDQDKDFSRFVQDLPSINRAILLDLFSLCADVTLLSDLNTMNLSAVAKAISLCILDEPERDFTTFDDSLKQRSFTGAACEDLFRAFLRIKRSQDLAMVDQEDEVDENRYIDNKTRVLKSARQQTSEYTASNNGSSSSMHPDHINMPPSHSRIDVSLPSSAGSSMPGSAGGWSGLAHPGVGTPRSYANERDYFGLATPPPRPTSPLSHQGNMHTASLSRSQSIAQSFSRPMSPAPVVLVEKAEFEEIQQDQSHLTRLRQAFLRPALDLQRRCSVADMESLFRGSAHDDEEEDGYESEPEVSHSGYQNHLRQRSSAVDYQAHQPHYQQHNYEQQNGGRAFGEESPSRSIRSLSKQELLSMRLRQMREQGYTDAAIQHEQQYGFQRAQSQQELWSKDRAQFNSAPLQLSGGIPNRTRVATHSAHPLPRSPGSGSHRSKRNPSLRRSVSLDPRAMKARLRDSVGSQMTFQTEMTVDDEPNSRHLMVMNPDHQDPSRASSEFSLQQSPEDLEKEEQEQQGILLQEILNWPPQSAPMASPQAEQEEPCYGKSQGASNNNNNSSNSNNNSNGATGVRAFEVLSRPKDIEVSVIFTPITPLAPRTELRSKFQETFPDRPISPPPGYGNGAKRSLTANSARSSKLSPNSSSVAVSPRHPMRSMTSPHTGSNVGRPVPLQQGSTFSGVSSSMTTESKSKTSGFIRALSKLRSKTSDDMLKPGKINSQVGGAPAAITTAPPTVSIEPPRLELNFLGDLMAGSSAGQDLMTAPALMSTGRGGPEALKSWRQQAQASLPVPGDIASVPSSPSSKEHDQMVPKGFVGARRASAATVGSIQHPVTPPRRRFKKGSMSPTTSPRQIGAATNRKKSNASIDHGAGVSSPKQSSAQEGEETEMVMEFDLSAVAGTSASFSASPIDNNIPKKSAAVQNEFRFSTATLLKDGKLYYQLQWDQFSELGFKSDLFTEPEQDLSGTNQQRLSQTGRSTGGAAAAATGVEMMTPPQRAPRHPLHQKYGSDPLGQKNHTLGQGYAPGPSLEQRRAAMKAAEASFLALAKDPEALATLKANEATIISKGMFVRGSTQPLIENVLPRPIPLARKSSLRYRDQSCMSSVSASTPTSTSHSSAENTPRNSLQSTTHSMISATSPRGNNVSGAGSVLGSLQRSMSDRSSPSSFAKGGSMGPRPSMGFGTQSMEQRLGQAAAGGGGRGSLSSSSSLPPQQRHRLTDNKLAISAVTNSTAAASTMTAGTAMTTMTTNSTATMSTKPIKKRGLFGKKNKAAKGSKDPTLSGLPSSVNGRKRRLLPVGVRHQDVMTKTEESLDEVFPWMCIEHMAGQESGWVMLEPVQDGAVGWVVIDKLEEHIAHHAQSEPEQQQQQQQQGYEDQQVPRSSSSNNSNHSSNNGLLELELGKPLFEANSAMLLA
ncbi:hypothetical protein EMPS_02643 [Entomortierella parvispora]|uniref:Rho-GAP domain-containing protein n=1 Tax=Entomortierella parvispora TaxID=205924 RepID=A0A9P3H5A2_9FUNG|nr:hypothetical protein EMPS_02643 [Entomortierella parvispora]